MPSYTLDELIKKMEPQNQRDKALISECIAGLGLYAAQIAQGDSNSSKIAETRKLIEDLVGYWGLDDGERAPSQDDILSAFDEQIHAAKSGAEIAAGTYRQHTDTIYGLHRYGEELVVAQGDDAMSEILDMSDLIKEIALHWDFEPYSVVDELTAGLRAEVRGMLEAIPLPGQPMSGENAGYKLQQAILFNNDRGFALAHNPNAPAPFVTWQFTNEDGEMNHYWGHYMGSEERARIDYISRATDYMESYKVAEKPIPTAAAEMSAEQNHNMIDGIHNNEAPAERIPVRVLSESQPLVTVTFSEHDQLRGVEKMPLYLADKLRAEVRTMLEAIPLPGQPMIGENADYKLQQAILFGNDRGFALAHNPNAPAPFVTWQFTNEDGEMNHYWGHYMGSEERARIDYISRVTDYMESYKVAEKPIPTAAAEMSAEQNHNMIDGIHNNEAPAERIPVRVLSESQPLVTVTFSEHDQLRGIEKMPLYLADKLFEELDEKLIETRSQPGYDGANFLKTDYRIDYIMDGKPDSFSGQYAVGDDDGSLLYRIYHYNEWNRRENEDYQQHLAGQGVGVQAAENARLDHIINKLVPFFETHCELSEKEAAALSELMCIQDDKAHGKPVDDARAGYLETVVEYTWASRAALNTTGIGSLPEEPKPYAETAKDRAAPVPCVQASVLEQIRAAREVPRQPSRPKPGREKKSHGPEL